MRFETVAANLLDWLAEIETAANCLLLDHSDIWEWARSGSMIITGSPFAWSDLEPEGRVLQSHLLEEFDRWCELVNAITARSAENVVEDIESAQGAIRDCIDQSDPTFLADLGDAVRHISDRFSTLRRLLEPLSVHSEGEAIIVPDTNALLYETHLDEWKFAEIPMFEMILLPTVLAELDSLKINHRDAELKKKAEGLIRRIKEYRRRGRLTEGVTLRRDVSTLRAWPKEPIDMPLSWLDSTNSDDRILASTMEVMRLHPARVVILVTRDINLQNKAEFAHVPFLEPPDLGWRLG